MNTENYDKVLDKIASCPGQWNQSQWHCGSSHCFAGWSQILSGQPADDATVRRDARIFLDISKPLADWLFDATRTLSEFHQFRDADYDSDGYDHAGYNSDGYNRDGYDRAGYDSDGYNRSGYNSAGYDRDGLDQNNKPKSL